MSQARLFYRCPVCTQVSAARSLSVDERGVELCCAACGVAMRFPPYAPESAQDSEARPPQEPSGASTAEVEASDLEESGGDAVPAHDPRLLLVDEIDELDPAVAQAYRLAVRSGDSLDAHRAVLRAGVASQALADVGSLYRRRLHKIPADDIAERIREEVVALAVAQLPRSDPEQQRQKAKRVQGVMAAVLLAAALIFSGLMMARTGCPASVPSSPGGASADAPEMTR